MKILAFGATNSKNSINKALAKYTANKIKDGNVEVIDLNDYEMPIYSIEKEKEKEDGIPEKAKNLFEKIGNSDILTISLAEFNFSYTPAYKNIFDWMSRIDMKVFQGKKVIYLSTSPGFGGKKVLSHAIEVIEFFNGKLIGSYSLEKFYDNFSLEKEKIINPEKEEEINELINKI